MTLVSLVIVYTKVRCIRFHLICAVPHFGILFLQHHPESGECHEKAVAHIPKHHRKQEGKCDDGVECYWNVEKVRYGVCRSVIYSVCTVCVLGCYLGWPLYSWLPRKHPQYSGNLQWTHSWGKGWEERCQQANDCRMNQHCCHFFSEKQKERESKRAWFQFSNIQLCSFLLSIPYQKK